MRSIKAPRQDVGRFLCLVTTVAFSCAAAAQGRYSGGSGAGDTDFSNMFSGVTDSEGGASVKPRSGSAVTPSNSRGLEPAGSGAESTNSSRLQRLGGGSAPRQQPTDRSSAGRPSAPRGATSPRRTTPPTNPFSSGSRDTAPNTPPAYARDRQTTRSNALREDSQQAPSSTSRSLPRGGVAGSRFDASALPTNTREAQTQKMLRKMMRAPDNSRLSGTPTRLSALLSGVGGRDRQGAVTDAYWALTSSMIDYYLSLHEANEVARLERSVPTYSNALAEVRRGLQTRVETSLMSARAAQMKLERMAPVASRPLPIDTPFCGPYATRYEQIFPGGAPEEARLLAEILPLRLGEIEAAGEGVARYEQWVKDVERASARRADATGIVRALELLALSRRAFVQLVRDYNQKINRYASLATPGEVDTGRLVAMLIRTDRQDLQNRSVLTAGARPGELNPTYSGGVYSGGERR
ncbi:MAG: hypothetical protein AAFV43_15045 [Planctomycetota bacterium]